MNVSAPAEAAVLHDRLQTTPDYAALAAIVDARLEAVLVELERGGHDLVRFEHLAGQLCGIRASRGASTVRTRGQKA